MDEVVVRGCRIAVHAFHFPIGWMLAVEPLSKESWALGEKK